MEHYHSDLQTTFLNIVLAKIYSSSSDDDDLSLVDLYLLSVHLKLDLMSLLGTTQLSSSNRAIFSNGYRNLLLNWGIFPDSISRCLQGNVVCLCPACHSADRCRFNFKSFSFTLDQLFSADLLCKVLNYFLPSSIPLVQNEILGAKSALLIFKRSSKIFLFRNFSFLNWLSVVQKLQRITIYIRVDRSSAWFLEYHDVVNKTRPNR